MNRVKTVPSAPDADVPADSPESCPPSHVTIVDQPESSDAASVNVHAPEEEVSVGPHDAQDVAEGRTGVSQQPSIGSTPVPVAQIPDSAADPLSFLPAASRSGREIRRNPIRYGV